MSHKSLASVFIAGATGPPVSVLTNGPVDGAPAQAGSSSLPSSLGAFCVMRATYRLRGSAAFTARTGIDAASTRPSPSWAPDLTVIRVVPRQRPT